MEGRKRKRGIEKRNGKEWSRERKEDEIKEGVEGRRME